MSFDRDQKMDRRQTERVMRGERPPVDLSDAKMNWLGHKAGYGTAVLDEMLIRGATVKEMSDVRGAIRQHLRHLEKEHGLNLVSLGGTAGSPEARYRFSKQQEFPSKHFYKAFKHA
jgi:uncharacterized protein YceH (UPF0502 family)